MTPENEIIEEKVYVGYCNQCGVYYIFRRDYYALKEKGKLLCKVIDSEPKNVISDAYFDLNPQSVLSKMGYNVQATTNLSTGERQEILRRVIDEGALSVNEILNLLEMHIHLHDGKEKYGNAEIKWKDDAEFVKKYGTNSGRKKNITELNV